MTAKLILFNHERCEITRKKNTVYHEGHEENEGFVFRTTNRLAVGSRPASRRWRVMGNIFCLQWKPGQFRFSPCIPTSEFMAQNQFLRASVAWPAYDCAATLGVRHSCAAFGLLRSFNHERHERYEKEGIFFYPVYSLHPC